jgi:hypothetical protein
MCYNNKTKICRICTIEKLANDFHSKKAYCKTCGKDFERNQKLLYKYGIDSQQYDEMLLKQGGKCSICKNPPALVGNLVVDHNHECCPSEKTCGKCIRSLICQMCNKGLGCFLDSIQLLSTAIEYLNNHDENRKEVF